MGVVDIGEPGAGWDFAGPRAVAPSGAAVIGYRDVRGAGLDLRVAATAAVAVVIEFGGRELIVDDAGGRQALGGFVVGLPMSAMRIRARHAECVEVRLSPIQAYSLLGVAANDLGHGVVPLEQLWGSQARRLRERLADAGNWEERFALTKSVLAQCDRPARTPDPEVVAAWRRILASGGQAKVSELAESLGWSRKRLWARFESQIGLTPKRAAMLVRFRCAVDGLLAGRPAADVAAVCGYTDQAHLCRDVAIFADRTPGALHTGDLPAIARDRYRAWGTFFQSPA
ncbi:AraC family transcriptional regulator [Nocardia huaxiensis]|uniref:AraC family transcriptional regulator n=1 Tax=Nocardia huaxiensis TaxID=2755382 RepID=A0A7D6VAL2_9NOCA|nr:helix-turn-helix domain-containing protein [Nocardia huaxiensis]QLY28217.1 AraC family transcriptional regulator [Nocardia huaxiensis]